MSMPTICNFATCGQMIVALAEAIVFTIKNEIFARSGRHFEHEAKQCK
jgi:hypothetical protein